MSATPQPGWSWAALTPQEHGRPCGGDLDCEQPAAVVLVRHEPPYRFVLCGSCARTSGCPQQLLEGSAVEADAEDASIAQAAAALGLPEICPIILSGLEVHRLLQGLHVAAAEYIAGGDCPDCRRAHEVSGGSQAVCENHIEDFHKAAEWLRMAEQISTQTGVTYP
ncbi:hypothetical protein ACFV1N_46920 [Streptosporangium canum]|uniref:hypothetical protein n=1 Tax=Streptosporangium canum TaxID=324952 RepID=UPI0036A113C7